jgi:Flp pilus assembly protein TadD
VSVLRREATLDSPFRTDVLGNADRELCRQSIAMVQAGEYECVWRLARTAAEAAPTHPLPLYLEAWSLAYPSRFEEARDALDTYQHEISGLSWVCS